MLEIRRKIVHASGVLTIFLIPLFGKWVTASVTLAIALAFLILGEYRKERGKYKIIRSKKLDEFEEFLENGFREYERPKNLPFEGAIEFFLGCFFAIVLFEPIPAMAAIAVLSLADAASTLIGVHYGRYKVFFNKKKTLEGSLAFFATAFVTLVFFLEPMYAALTAFFATIAELLPKVNDNITIPIVVGILVTIIS